MKAAVSNLAAAAFLLGVAGFVAAVGRGFGRLAVELWPDSPWLVIGGAGLALALLGAVALRVIEDWP